MPNTINLRLLENKNIIAELNGIPLANENSYKIIAGEENATIFRIASKPNQYTNARYTVEMVNSQGYGFQEVDIVDNSFVLPKGMAVAGYGLMKIRAYQGEEIVPFANLKIKVQNTLPDWQQYIVDAGKIVQSKGVATDKVMSQKATTEELDSLEKSLAFVAGEFTAFEEDQKQTNQNIYEKIAQIETGGGGSGGTIVVDGELKDSPNPVENRVINSAIQQLSQVLNTKPTEFFVSVNDTFSNGVEGAQWFDYDGNDITSQIGAGNYVDSNCRNNLFNSQETSVRIFPETPQETFIITRQPQMVTSVKYVVLTVTQIGLINNKIIRIIEQNIPDRSGQGNYAYYEVKGALNDYSRYGTYTILASSWLETAGIEPFTHMTVTNGGGTLTADEINNKNCVLNLLNDQPLEFVKHGFQIRNIIAQDFGVFVNIMSVGAPTKDITFSFKGEVIE